MKNLRIFFVVSTLIIIFAVGAIASTTYLGNTLQTNYSAGETIRGNVFLTLSQEPSNRTVTSNFQGNISLIDFVRNQPGLSEGSEYNCSAQGCVNRYESTGPVSGFSLSQNGSKIAGFSVNGPGISITGATFSVQSNALASCTPQIEIDLLNDGIDLFVNNQIGPQSCGVVYDGCYNQANTIEANLATGIEYCESMTMPAAPGFIIGGQVRNGTSVANLTMKLYDATNGGVAGTCQLPRHTEILQELSCAINYTSSETRDYYVCITPSANAGYKIGWETTGQNCGTAQGFGVFSSDFDLFAQTIQYSGAPSFVINDTTYDAQHGLELAEVLDGYIVDVYGRNCQTQPCVIPIKFSGGSQFVQLSNSLISYESVGVPDTSSGMYELVQTPSKISGNNLSLDLQRANFVIPINSEEDEFKLLFDGVEIFSKAIMIKRSFNLDVQPKVVAFGQNAQFTAIAETNITSTTWNFGDGTPTQTTNGSSINHIYTQTNNSVFTLNITAISNQGWKANKLVSIFVGDPRELANDTIKDYKKRIENITRDINSYPSWEIPKLQSILELQDASAELTAIENRYRSATTEEDFQEVMIDLIDLKIPRRVYNLKSGTSLPLSAGYESFNINYLERIENEDVSDNAELTERVIGWMNENFNSEISFQHITAAYDFENEVIASTFYIETKPIESPSTTTYLILGQDVENAGLYKTNYNVRSISGVGIDYLQLDTSSNKVFEFLLEGEIAFEDLGAYIAPKIEALDIVEIGGSCNLDGVCDSDEDVDNCPEDCSRRAFKFTIVSWIILFIVAIVVYIILQEWYKHRYQKHLFPDENDLYNLINFIYNARRTRLADGQIHSRLSQQGWTSEKISFAFKKIDGRRIGMLEIPIFTHREHRKTVNAIATRQGAPVDARFIKRPSLK